MSTPHRATPEQWADHERWTHDHDSSCLLELRARIEALEAGATCPHIVTGDEGTSYCALAEVTARIGQPDVPANTSAQTNSKPTSNPGQIRSSLVERVARAISLDSWDTDPVSWTAEARAAIGAVAEWLRKQPWPNAASALEKELKR